MIDAGDGPFTRREYRDALRKAAQAMGKKAGPSWAFSARLAAGFADDIEEGGDLDKPYVTDSATKQAINNLLR